MNFNQKATRKLQTPTAPTESGGGGEWGKEHEMLVQPNVQLNKLDIKEFPLPAPPSPKKHTVHMQNKTK